MSIKDKGALIFCDLEGICGIGLRHRSSFISDSEFWEESKSLYLSELNIVIEALRSQGYSNVEICDIHNDGSNFSVGELTYDKKQIKVRKIKTYPEVCFNDIRSKAVIFIGFHPINKTRGFFPHNFRKEIKHIVIDNDIVGESEIFLELFTSKGLPIISFSGCRTSIEQVLDRFPGIQTLEVKYYKKGREYHLSNDELMLGYKERISNSKEWFTKDRVRIGEAKIILDEEFLLDYELDDLAGLCHFSGVSIDELIDGIYKVLQKLVKMYEDKQRELIIALQNIVSNSRLMQEFSSWEKFDDIIKKPIPEINKYEYDYIVNLCN